MTTRYGQLLYLASRRLSTVAMASGEIVIAKNEMRRFMVECLTRAGAVESHAEQLSDVLIAGDERGHYSHGLNRLDMYVRDLQHKTCKGEGTPTVLKDRAGTAWVDGNNLLGPVVGNFCMDLAMEKAKTAGVGWVVAKGSNHFGIAGWYSMNAVKKGLIGLAFTNTSPVSYPTRSAVPALGTNPLSVAAGAAADDAFVLDMATTTVAVGKIEIASRKGAPVPDTWGVQKGGAGTTEPEKILQGGGLLPLGGQEISGGYKGYGLSAMVELFCGVLGGAHWGPHVRKWMSSHEDADLGQCFVAVDPEAFAPGFSERMVEYLQTLRNLPHVGSDSVEVAGDMERRHENLVKDLGGIPYHPNQMEFAKDLAEKMAVAPPAAVKTL